jgi:hypothetical protein
VHQEVPVLSRAPEGDREEALAEITRLAALAKAAVSVGRAVLVVVQRVAPCMAYRNFYRLSEGPEAVREQQTIPVPVVMAVGGAVHC